MKIDLLRQLIREEITKALRKELPRILNEAMELSTSSSPISLYTEPTPTRKPTLQFESTEPEQFATISDILSSTRPFSKEERQGMVGFGDLGLTQINESVDMYKQDVTQDIVTGLDHKPINRDKPEVQKVLKAINRDYSHLIKTFKK